MLDTDREQKRQRLRKEKLSQRQPKKRKLLEMTSIDEENMEGKKALKQNEVSMTRQLICSRRTGQFNGHPRP